MKRDYFINKGQQDINGPRADDYGDAKKTHEQIADIVNILIAENIERGLPLRADQIMKIHIATKLIRLNSTPDHVDSITDIIGYAALLGEILTEDKTRKVLKTTIGTTVKDHL